MNEFTKEELKQLYDILWRYDDLSPIGEEGKFDSVMLKIQSMIDNYCDHSDCFELDTDSVILGCNNCNKVWYE